MKNYKAKIVIAAVGVIGILIMEFLKMPSNYILLWILFIAILLFAFSPEIKRFFIGRRGVEFEHFEAQVNEAMVQYEKFKQTINPLLEASMAQMVGGIYMGRQPKTEVLIDYLPKIKSVIDDDHYTDETFVNLYNAVKSITLDEFATELNLIVVYGLNVNGNSEVLELIESGLKNDYSSNQYVDKDAIFVDFEGLRKISNKLSGSYKDRYDKKLKSLERFYTNYFN